MTPLWCRVFPMPYKDPEKERENRKGRAKKYRENHPERLRSAQKRYYDRTAQIQRLKSLEWHYSNRDHVLERMRWASIKRRYGLTREQYESLSNCCGICGSDGNGKNLHVDHNHKTRKVRGKLCSSCNVGLGHFRNDAALLRKAAEYVDLDID